ncbi:MAG TPA: hypothetical protein PKM88_15555 [bacterium]|nr:hypothetical protein [bacterium]
MAAEFDNFSLGLIAGDRGPFIPSRQQVTFTGVTTAAISTRLRKVYCGGVVEVVSGVGGGTLTPSTTVPGQLDAAGFTAGDVIYIAAFGSL